MAAIFDNTASAYLSLANTFLAGSSLTYPFFVSIWVKPDSANLTENDNVFVYSTSTAVNTAGFAIYQSQVTNPDKWGISANGGSAATAGTATTGWQHILALWTSDNRRDIWVNGSDTANSTAAETLNTGIDSLVIGARPNAPIDRYFDGKMAHLLIGHNYTPTTGAGSDLEYLQTKLPTHPDLASLYAAGIAYYPFTEATAATDSLASYDLSNSSVTFSDADVPSLAAGASAVKGRNLLLGVG